jgi:hypothetical protein
MNHANRHLSVNESVVSARLDGEAVLLNVETGIYFGLDEVGTRIWELLAQGADERKVLGQLLQEYDVEEAQLSADISGFIAHLAAAGLVRRHLRPSRSSVEDPLPESATGSASSRGR